ncbi:complement resistance protein TraT [Helicobacter sp. MIT 05-5294]|uniref:complement resistance protein TraT n=1 Tax=Helicobacter sp. MIT 05-5294 TaxID=1548150 RepID=UPI00051F8EA7|nr:complement resistance protein TraT [Helicobacter sp. MIT 05-5294]TLD89268.1 conjugal transfer protein TraT [Helicobacter sp. MIT 05-5294]
MRTIWIPFLCILALSGCVTTNLETKATMSQSIFIDPVAKSKQTIFVALRNTSGQEIDLESKILRKLQSKGYTIVEDPEVATFILQANVLYCDTKKENNAVGAGVVGGAVGAGVGGYNHHSTTGTVVGGLAGAAAGAILGKLTEDTIFQMQVDINVRQRIEGGTYNYNSTVSGQASVSDGRRAGFLNSFGGNAASTQGGGKLNSNQATLNEQAYSGNYSEKSTTLLAEATKLNLTLQEAIPVLEDKISTQISGIF